MKNILVVAGARPNFMKIAPLMRTMRKDSFFAPKLVHTGQHYDKSMSDVFFVELGIEPPSVNLGVGSGSRLEQIASIKRLFRDVVERERPDAIIVVGDVNSTIACAQVGVDLDVAVVHVEAGLRSFDKRMPEELNRIETDQISDYLFVTERSGMNNLESEGVPGKSFLVGNVMIDTLVSQLEICRRKQKYRELGLEPGNYVVGTFHRPSNVDQPEPLRNVLKIIREISRQHQFVLPLHPRTRKSLEHHELLGEIEGQAGVTVVEPLGYQDFISLVEGSVCVVTDSGGIQEETTYLGIPCVTMRDTTERPVTVTDGTNQLAGTSPADVLECFDRVLREPVDIQAYRPPELWDGKAAQRIAAILRQELA